MIGNHVPETRAMPADSPPPPNPPKGGSAVKPAAAPPMEYYVFTDRWDQEGQPPAGWISERLTYLSADRGWEVFAVTGPYPDGHTQYLLARRAAQ